MKIAQGNSRFVVITEGLDAGDTVALYNPEKAGESQGAKPGGAESGESDNGNGRP